MLKDDICFRALDHGRHARWDGRILAHLESHFRSGVLSQKERVKREFHLPWAISEVVARIVTGRLNEPHNEVYVLSPKSFPEHGKVDSLLLDKFSQLTESAHRALLVISSPHQADSGKWGNYVIPESVPLEERNIIGVVLRTRYIKTQTIDRVGEICALYWLEWCDESRMEQAIGHWNFSVQRWNFFNKEILLPQ